MPARKPPPEKPANKRVVLIDDHALMRRGLKALIESESDMLVCAEAATRAAGYDAALSEKPDLVIADLSLGDSDGMELIKDLHRRLPLLPVPVLSIHEEEVYAERALRAGARGYLAKKKWTTRCSSPSAACWRGRFTRATRLPGSSREICGWRRGREGRRRRSVQRP